MGFSLKQRLWIAIVGLFLTWVFSSCSPLQRFDMHKDKLKKLSDKYGYQITTVDTIRDTVVFDSISIRKEFIVEHDVIHDTLYHVDTVTNTEVRIEYLKDDKGNVNLNVSVDKEQEEIIREHLCEKEQFVISELEVELKRYKNIFIVSIILLILIVAVKFLLNALRN